MKKFGELLYIEWIDACEKSGWKSVKDAVIVDDEVKCRTVGFFLKETTDFIIVANTIGNSAINDVSGVWQIPKKWIKKLKRMSICRKKL